MERIDALKELLAKVEAGSFPVGRSADAFGDKFGPTPIDAHWGHAKGAFDGSFDAFLALFNLVLPEWIWAGASINAMDDTEHPMMMIAPNKEVVSDNETHHGSSETAARAGLIAILKAIIAQEGGE